MMVLSLVGKTYGLSKKERKHEIKHDGKKKHDSKGKKRKHAIPAKEIKLKKGREYFKAIATLEPMNLETFVKEANNGTLPNESWKTVDLAVNVK